MTNGGIATLEYIKKGLKTYGRHFYLKRNPRPH